MGGGGGQNSEKQINKNSCLGRGQLGQKQFFFFFFFFLGGGGKIVRSKKKCLRGIRGKKNIFGGRQCSHAPLVLPLLECIICKLVGLTWALWAGELDLCVVDDCSCGDFGTPAVACAAVALGGGIQSIRGALGHKSTRQVQFFNPFLLTGTWGRFSCRN